MVTKIGRIVGGDSEKIVIRKDAGVEVDLGEIIFLTDKEKNIYFYQIYHMEQRSLLDTKDIHISAYNLDKYAQEVDIYDKEERYYQILYAKPLVKILPQKWEFIKNIPTMFQEVYKIDVSLGKKLVEMCGNGLDIGKLRSGNRVLDIPVPFDIGNAITHHILIAATTGRGKSNLMKVLIWKLLSQHEIGFLVMDPHAEYLTPSKYSLISHPLSNERIVLYSPSSRAREYFSNVYHLVIDISLLKPQHFLSVFSFSEPQLQAMYILYQKYKHSWIKNLVTKEKVNDHENLPLIKEDTYGALRRKIMFYLGITYYDSVIEYNSIFKEGEGSKFSEHILSSLEKGMVVIVDSSELSTSEELLVMSLLSQSIFDTYKRYKKENILKDKAKIGIVLEEAPRVLNTSFLASDMNIFGTMAREGRKFNIGLIAITQLPSLIPTEIISNMNTKILLGIEMQKERNIVISSSPQDLSKDERIIASLNKGEAIITSIFTPFPIPLYIYHFNDLVDKESSLNNNEKESFSALVSEEDIEI